MEAPSDDSEQRVSSETDLLEEMGENLMKILRRSSDILEDIPG